MRMTLSEKNSHENLIVFYVSLLCLCVPVFTREPFDQRHPSLIDKVKHEGQILPNIDLNKQSPPPAACAALTSPQCQCHTVNIVTSACGAFISMWRWRCKFVVHLMNLAY